MPVRAVSGCACSTIATTPEVAHDVERWSSDRDADEIVSLLDSMPPFDAVGHRVVHGGREFRDAVRIDAGVVRAIRALTPLAPLHQPRAVAGIDLLRRLYPDLPQVACFDTAFHATLGPAASTYALPQSWRDRWGLERFGFHGLSHAYASRRAAALADRGDEPDLRVVTCHLGSGASLAATRGGRSVDTTMGFTPLEGLVMATRSGTIDPGLVLWLDAAGRSRDRGDCTGPRVGVGARGLVGYPGRRHAGCSRRARPG